MVKVIFRNYEWQVPGNIIIRELITGLGRNPESILAVRDGKLVNNDHQTWKSGRDQADFRCFGRIGNARISLPQMRRGKCDQYAPA
jgi:hypothetical protein